MTNRHYHAKEYKLEYRFDGDEAWITDSSFPRMSQALSVYFNVTDQKEAGITWRVKKP